MKAQTCVNCKGKFWHYRLISRCDQCSRIQWWGQWVVPTITLTRAMER
jgi:hypothetical protein